MVILGLDSGSAATKAAFIELLKIVRRMRI